MTESSASPANGGVGCALRLEPRFRQLLYVTVGALFVTGAGWLAMHWLRQEGGTEAWGKGASYVLMLHGAAAMLMLVLLGALLPFHTVISWRRRENRGMGTVMLAVNAILVVTAFGLYYVGSDALRRWTSDVHIVVGLSVPLLLAAHVVTGRAAIRASRRARTARHRRALKHDPR